MHEARVRLPGEHGSNVHTPGTVSQQIGLVRKRAVHLSYVRMGQQVSTQAKHAVKTALTN
jgi:hypothetical protein